MSRLTFASLLLLGAVIAPGCAMSQGHRDAPGWLAARGADLMDIVGVRVAVGPGLGAYVRATQYLQFGIIKKGPGERDLPSPKGGEPRAVNCFVFGTIGRYGGAWFESSTEVMFPGWSSRDRRLTADKGLAIDRDVIAGYVSPHGEHDMWREAFGVGAHLILIGAEVEVRPFQLLDFLLGIGGYDPAGDDLPADSGSSPPLAPEAADAADSSSRI